MFRCFGPTSQRRCKRIRPCIRLCTMQVVSHSMQVIHQQYFLRKSMNPLEVVPGSGKGQVLSFGRWTSKGPCHPLRLLQCNPKGSMQVLTNSSSQDRLQWEKGIARSAATEISIDKYISQEHGALGALLRVVGRHRNGPSPAKKVLGCVGDEASASGSNHMKLAVYRYAWDDDVWTLGIPTVGASWDFARHSMGLEYLHRL